MTDARSDGDAEALAPNARWGLMLTAMAVLVLQVALTRLLSVAMWYHFAFVAISLAMLGLAVGGLVLYLVPSLMRAVPRLLPLACHATSLSTIAALLYVINTSIDARSGGAFGDSVVAFYLVTLVPFFTSGFVVSAVLSYGARQITTLYLFDLVGAGIGCIVVIGLLETLGAPGAVVVAALMFSLAALLFRRSGVGRSALDGVMCLALVALLVLQVATGVFEPSSMHGRSDADVARSEVKLAERWNSHSRVVATQISDSTVQINIDGHATTPCQRIDGLATRENVIAQAPDMVLRPTALPYLVLPDSPSVVIVGPGGGPDVLAAIAQNATVTGVELNGIIYEMMTEGVLAEWSGHLYTAPGVTMVHDEARSWLRRSERKFDLIQTVQVDTWAATSAGAFALAENALYTVEAFEESFDHLTDEGIVSINRWHPEPARESLRLLVLIDEVMRRRAIAEPERHLVVLLDHIDRSRNAAQALVFWARSPFTDQQLARLDAIVTRSAKRDGKLEKAVWPGEQLDNELSRFFRSSDKAGFIAAYPYDISATTDDRPFFFNTLRVTDMFSATEATLANEQAVEVLLTVLFTVAILATLSLLVPFIVAQVTGRAERGWGTIVRLTYFCGLGFGFMLVEIPLLQRFGLYLGHPTYALSTILASLLVGAGLGSLAAGRLWGNDPARGMRVALIAVVILVAAMGFGLAPLLHSTLLWSIGERIALTVALVGPLGFVLGMPFPLGVSALSERRAPLVPWAWAMNGATSVLASVLAVVIGMHGGFTVASVIGAGGYLVCLACSPALTAE